MQVKVKINYNPAKLVKALPKIIENFMKGSGTFCRLCLWEGDPEYPYFSEQFG